MPRVSILMSAYNDANYIEQAVESVLTQTYQDFELILIDDHSHDNTFEIMQTFTDPKIRIYQNDQNLGLAGSLNRGLALSNAEFIARADSDDLVTPTWLADQIRFLDDHPDIGMVCGNLIEIDAEGNLLNEGKPLYNHPAPDGYFQWDLLLRCTVPHNTVVMRREILARDHLHYDTAFTTVEDHDLWSRLQNVTKIHRQQTTFAHYRIHQASASRAQRQKQLNHQRDVVRRQFKDLLGTVDDSALQTLFESIHNAKIDHQNFFGAAQLLVKSYRKILNKDISAEAKQYIMADVVGYLIRLARRPPKWTGRLVLCHMIYISRNEFFSRQMIQKLINPKKI